jgi:hypothetical protein
MPFAAFYVVLFCFFLSKNSFAHGNQIDIKCTVGDAINQVVLDIDRSIESMDQAI